MNPSDLDDRQLRIAVAEALGWANIHLATHDDLYKVDALHGWLDSPVGDPPWYKGKNLQENLDPIPSFENDLDACHQFEKSLLFPPTGTPAPEANAIWSRFDRYVEQLAKMCGSDEIFFATARQRCCALLMALDKEKE